MNYRRGDLLQNLLYGLLLLSFLVLYFLLSINNRPAADDFYFLKNFQDYGWWQSIVVSWQSWVTRWASILLLNLIFGLYTLTGSFLFIHIITLLTLCFALYRITSSGIDFFLQQLHTSNKSLNRIADLPRYSRFTVLVLISFFFLSGGIGETFFWITSSSMYLWSFIALCFLIAELLKPGQKLYSYIICMITAAFVGGAAEAIAVPLAVLLILFLVIQVRKKASVVPALVSLVVLAGSLLVSYSGEGRALRQSALPDVTFYRALVWTVKSIAQIEIHFFRDNLIWTTLFFVAWTGFAEKIPAVKLFNRSSILALLMIYAALCLLFVFPASWLLGDLLSFRAWIMVTFLNCCCLAIAGIFAGQLLRKPVLVRIVSSAALIALVGLILETTIDQKQIAGKYSYAVDSRMQFLSTLVDPEDSSEIILDGLPDSGLLISSEISTDRSDFRNQHLKNYLGIKGELRVK